MNRADIPFFDISGAGIDKDREVEEITQCQPGGAVHACTRRLQDV